jgi:hypothetical protein
LEASENGTIAQTVAFEPPAEIHFHRWFKSKVSRMWKWISTGGSKATVCDVGYFYIIKYIH